MKVMNVTLTRRQMFHYWMDVTYPLHKLGKTEQSVFAEMLFYRDLLKDKVSDDTLLNKLVFDHEVKVKIMKTLNLKQNRLALALTKLRKQGAIIGRTINVNYLPDIKDNEAVMAYKFVIKNEAGETNKEEILNENNENS